MSQNTLVSQQELELKCRAEGVNPEDVSVIEPRWAESAPRSPGVKSALVKCDLILRSDGSAVLLDGIVSIDSRAIFKAHTGYGETEGHRQVVSKIFPELGDMWAPTVYMCAKAIETVGWEEYVRRLKNS